MTSTILFRFGAICVRSLPKALLLLPLAGLFALSAVAQEVVNTNRATDMRAAPDDTAVVVQMLAPQTKVQVLERRGAWTRVKGLSADAASGWVRMMHLRGEVIVEQAAPQRGSGVMGGLNRFFGGSQQTAAPRAQSATLGIRGLSPEELQAAAPNPQALAKMRGFAATKDEAAAFAKTANLAVAVVDDPGEQSAAKPGAKR